MEITKDHQNIFRILTMQKFLKNEKNKQKGRETFRILWFLNNENNLRYNLSI